ncbi:hypothetical protein [Chromobacterium subtsugae]|uniref:hypothetical protein n=1 Tax=Chromobacterium subtsugae TaxID=251747 RepID=UPI00128B05D1|nr:hypothetical protein [Chromobacterium subtsugae]
MQLSQTRSTIRFVFTFTNILADMSTNAQKAKRVYGPRGVAKSKTVQFRVPTAKRLLITELACMLEMTESNLGRELVDVALPIFLAQHGLTAWAEDTLKALTA